MIGSSRSAVIRWTYCGVTAVSSMTTPAAFAVARPAAAPMSSIEAAASRARTATWSSSPNRPPLIATPPSRSRLPSAVVVASGAVEPAGSQRSQSHPAPRVFSGGGHDRDAIGTGIRVGAEPGRHSIGATQRTHPVEQFAGDSDRQFAASSPGPRATDQAVETQRAEHFAIAGRGEVHRQLSCQLGVRGRTGVDGDRHPHREARRGAARPAAAAALSIAARTRPTRNGDARLSTTSSACCAARRIMPGPNAPNAIRVSGAAPRSRNPRLLT